MKQWRCTVCGYVHTGDEPPEKCPVCGADSSLFELIEPPATSVDSGAKQTETAPAEQDEQEAAADQQPAAPSSQTVGADEATPSAATDWQTRLLDTIVDLHGHPISVHIPNGVLPVAVLFLLLGLLTGSNALKTAAFYNVVFVALAMPLVIFTGYEDWQRRFGGNMTPVFRTKMICAAVVTLIAILLVIWRLVDPHVVSAWGSGRWFFVALHLIALGAAALAGYMGGKLIIFPKDPTRKG